MQSTQTGMFSGRDGDLWLLGVIVKMLGFAIWSLDYTSLIWAPVLVIAMVMIVVGIYKFHYT